MTEVAALVGRDSIRSTTSELQPTHLLRYPAYPHTATLYGIMSTEAQSFLASIQNNIRGRPISWEGAVRAKTITDADLKKIKSIDKVRKEQRKQTIEGDVDSFVTLLLGGNGAQSIFETAAKRQDIIHYMLVLLGDMIEGMFILGYLTARSAYLSHRQTYPPSQTLSSNTPRLTSRLCRC
jgi:V-type H+-transporting ATPase subunit H